MIFRKDLSGVLIMLFQVTIEINNNQEIKYLFFFFFFTILNMRMGSFFLSNCLFFFLISTFLRKMNYSTLREKIYVVHKQNKQIFLTLFFWTNTEPGTDGCIYQVSSLREDKYWPRTALDLCGFRIYLELYYNVAISLNGRHRYLTFCNRFLRG